MLRVTNKKNTCYSVTKYTKDMNRVFTGKEIQMSCNDVLRKWCTPFFPIRLVKIWKFWEHCGQKGRTAGVLMHYWWVYKLVRPLWGQFGSIKQNPNATALWLAVLLTGNNFTDIHLSKITHLYKIIHSALFVVAEEWNELKCPSTEGWLKTLRYD